MAMHGLQAGCKHSAAALAHERPCTRLLPLPHVGLSCDFEWGLMQCLRPLHLADSRCTAMGGQGDAWCSDWRMNGAAMLAHDRPRTCLLPAARAT